MRDELTGLHYDENQVFCVFDVQVAHENGPRRVPIIARGVSEAWAAIAHRSASFGVHHITEIKLVSYRRVDVQVVACKE